MPRLRRSEGFALVEILVSLMVLALGIFSAVGVFVSSQKTTNTAQRTDVAVTLGTQVLEELRSRPYADVALTQYTGAFPTGVDGDPRARVVSSGTRFDTKLAAGLEELVAYKAGAPAEFQTVTVGAGSAALTARIYRFVSWRDEECPLVDLGNLGATLTNLKAVLTTLVGAGGLLANLTGPGGSLENALTDSNSLLGGGLLSGLLAPLIGPLTNGVTKLGPLANALDPLEGPLKALLDQINAIGTPLNQIVGVLDLCDLPAGVVPDLSRIAALNAALNAISPLLTTLSPAVNSLVAIVHPLVSLNALQLVNLVLTGGLVTNLTTAVNSATACVLTCFNSVLAGVQTTLGTTLDLSILDDIANTAKDSLVGIDALLNAPNHTHNTKRISVAVQLVANARGKSIGPSKPVWLSTVVHDPKEGLL